MEQWRATLEGVFNVTGFLKYLAASTVFQNWDQYGMMAQNYYLYGDLARNRTVAWIPWDLNEAFQARPGGGMDMPAGGMNRTVGGMNPPPNNLLMQPALPNNNVARPDQAGRAPPPQQGNNIRAPQQPNNMQQQRAGGGRGPLPLNFTSIVNSNRSAPARGEWPLIEFLYRDPVYRHEYDRLVLQQVHSNETSPFGAELIVRDML